MKIAFFTHVFPPAIDGGSQIIAHLARQNAYQGGQSHVFTSNCHLSDEFVTGSPQPLSSHTENSGVAVSRFPVTSQLRPFFKPLNFHSFLDPLRFGPIFSLSSLTKIKKEISLFNPDLILAGPFPTAQNLLALYFSKTLRRPLLLLPCFHPTEASFSSPLLRLCLKKATKIIALTQAEASLYQKMGLPQSKVAIIPAGVQAALLSPHSPKSKSPTKSTRHPNHPNPHPNFSPPSLLFLGSESAHKNIPTLIEAFKILRHRYKYKNLKLLLGTVKTLHSPQIKKCISALPAKDRRFIVRRHSVRGAQKTTLLDQVTILVNPSSAESFGLVFLEAWARGKPVIGANIPAVKELITKNQGGLVSKEKDPSDLAKKIDTLLKDPALAQKLGQNGYRAVTQKYLWSRIGETFFNLCQTLLPQ